ncbi:hypothetical protein SLS60_009990 [Paraconiothyrium brasiliense]|uniref:Uncharacterized protein n=1 Tax=Paraconiothyrium brasiliense TaxID=300254 RepID=A0ABR3QT14_9PLEO
MKISIALLSILLGLTIALPRPETQRGGHHPESTALDLPHGTWRRALDAPHGSWIHNPASGTDDLEQISHSTEGPGGSPTSRKRQYSTSLIHPSFTHVWTVTPGVGYFEASQTGYVRFGTTETDQTFEPDTSLRGHNATVGFDVPQGTLTDGMSFEVFTALSTLVLEKDKDKANTNDSRGDYIARFIVNGGVAQLAHGEAGKFQVPDKEHFTLQIVGTFRVEFQFDTSAGKGLTVTRVG